MGRRRKFLFWIFGIAAFWLILCAVAGVAASEWTLHPPRLRLTNDAGERAAAIAKSHRAILQQVDVKANDGAILDAWFIAPSSWNGDAVILLHGMADNRAGMLGPAEMLLRDGYSVLLPDARAHGMSGGNLATYGFLESVDIERWSGWLAQNERPHCIDGLGESMGAALLLNSLKINHEFCAVAAESSFASFREASYVRIGEWFGTGPWLGRTLLRPVVESGILYVRFRYGIDLGQDNPAKAVASSRTPVLLIHGLADSNMPPYNSEQILAASKNGNPNVSLWEPPDAGHCGAMGSNPQEFEKRVVGWFESHSRNKQGG